MTKINIKLLVCTFICSFCLFESSAYSQNSTNSICPFKKTSPNSNALLSELKTALSVLANDDSCQNLSKAASKILDNNEFTNKVNSLFDMSSINCMNYDEFLKKDYEEAKNLITIGSSDNENTSPLILPFPQSYSICRNHSDVLKKLSCVEDIYKQQINQYQASCPADFNFNKKVSLNNAKKQFIIGLGNDISNLLDQSSDCEQKNKKVAGNVVSSVINYAVAYSSVMSGVGPIGAGVSLLGQILSKTMQTYFSKNTPKSLIDYLKKKEYDTQLNCLFYSIQSEIYQCNSQTDNQISVFNLSSFLGLANSAPTNFNNDTSDSTEKNKTVRLFNEYYYTNSNSIYKFVEALNTLKTSVKSDISYYPFDQLKIIEDIYNSKIPNAQYFLQQKSSNILNSIDSVYIISNNKIISFKEHLLLIANSLKKMASSVSVQQGQTLLVYIKWIDAILKNSNVLLDQKEIDKLNFSSIVKILASYWSESGYKEEISQLSEYRLNLQKNDPSAIESKRLDNLSQLSVLAQNSDQNSLILTLFQMGFKSHFENQLEKKYEAFVTARKNNDGIPELINLLDFCIYNYSMFVYDDVDNPEVDRVTNHVNLDQLYSTKYAKYCAPIACLKEQAGTFINQDQFEYSIKLAKDKSKSNIDELTKKMGLTNSEKIAEVQKQFNDIYNFIFSRPSLIGYMAIKQNQCRFRHTHLDILYKIMNKYYNEDIFDCSDKLKSYTNEFFKKTYGVEYN